MREVELFDVEAKVVEIGLYFFFVGNFLGVFGLESLWFCTLHHSVLLEEDN